MIDRRRLLQSMGLGLGWLGLGAPGALAGHSKAPRRLILLSHCQRSSKARIASRFSWLR